MCSLNCIYLSPLILKNQLRKVWAHVSNDQAPRSPFRTSIKKLSITRLLTRYRWHQKSFSRSSTSSPSSTSHLHPFKPPCEPAGHLLTMGVHSPLFQSSKYIARIPLLLRRLLRISLHTSVGTGPWLDSWPHIVGGGSREV